MTIINAGGSGFTSATPPTLEFEPPLNYENMRLVGNSGIGASVSVRVGSAPAAISFNITNYGYNYKIGDVLESTTDNQQVFQLMHLLVQSIHIIQTHCR